MPDYTIDELIEDGYGDASTVGATPNYIPKPTAEKKRVVLEFNLAKSFDNNIYHDYVKPRLDSKSLSFKAHVIDCLQMWEQLSSAKPDTTMLDNKFPHVVADLVLRGDKEMQEQIDELKRQNELLAATITMLTRRLDAQESALQDNVLLSTGNASKIAQTDGRVQSVGKWITSVQPLIVAVGKKHKLTDGK